MGLTNLDTNLHERIRRVGTGGCEERNQSAFSRYRLMFPISHDCLFLSIQTFLELICFCLSTSSGWAMRWRLIGDANDSSIENIGIGDADSYSYISFGSK